MPQSLSIFIDYIVQFVIYFAIVIVVCMIINKNSCVIKNSIMAAIITCIIMSFEFFIFSVRLGKENAQNAENASVEESTKTGSTKTKQETKQQPAKIKQQDKSSSVIETDTDTENAIITPAATQEPPSLTNSTSTASVSQTPNIQPTSTNTEGLEIDQQNTTNATSSNGFLNNITSGISNSFNKYFGKKDNKENQQQQNQQQLQSRNQPLTKQTQQNSQDLKPQQQRQIPEISSKKIQDNQQPRNNMELLPAEQFLIDKNQKQTTQQSNTIAPANNDDTIFRYSAVKTIKKPNQKDKTAYFYVEAKDWYPDTNNINNSMTSKSYTFDQVQPNLDDLNIRTRTLK